MRFFRTAVVAGALVAAGIFASVPAVAASTATQAASAQVQPLCSGYVTANPTYQSDPSYTTATVNVHWYCEGWFHVVSNIRWGDGQSDNYTCWTNCNSGTNQFNHVYVTRGDYHPYIYMNGSASGSTSVEIYIY